MNRKENPVLIKMNSKEDPIVMWLNSKKGDTNTHTYKTEAGKPYYFHIS